MATRYRYPTGARPLLLEETGRRRAVENKLVELLERSGYGEVVLPIIDFAAPYTGVVDNDTARQSYRFVDRDGELVSIRSDFTPMIARALAPAIVPDELPLRVFYRGDVIRCEASRLGVNREMFQLGAELIGDAGVEADLSMLELAASMVRAFDLEPLIVYNDASLVEEFDAPTREALRTKRASSELPPLALGMLAGSATIDDVRLVNVRVADRLSALGARLDDASFSLHLDDIEESATYYTGLRFRVYAGESRTLVAQGGRYDSLYGKFGGDAPAIGFTFTVETLLEACSRSAPQGASTLAVAGGR